MLKRILRLLQYLLFLGAGILLVWWQLRSMSAEERADFNNSLGYTNYWLILPVAIMSILSHLSRAMRWKLLLEPLNYHPRLKNVFAATMIGYLANAAVPRLGEVLKCTFLSRYEKLKMDRLFGTIIVERTFDFVCFLIFIGITIFIQFDLVGEFVAKQFAVLSDSPTSYLPLWAKVLIMLLVVAGSLFGLRFLLRRFPGNKFIVKLNGFARGIIDGFKTIKTLKHRGRFIAHTLFIWCMYLTQVYVGFRAMDGTSHLGVHAAFSVLTLATIAMIATPGGIGSFPIFVMETLAIYSISYPLGKAFGWLLWGVNTGIVIICGVAALVLLPLINKKRNEIDPIHTNENI